VPATGLGNVTHLDIADLAIDHNTVVVNSTPLWHDRLLAEADGRLLAAYATWETDRLPAEYVEILNRYGRVLVPSRFSASTFTSSGVGRPLYVVPHVARVPQSAGTSRKRDDRFRFYVIARWTARKAILDLVSAYLAAFTGSDEVLLTIHTTPVDHSAWNQLRATAEPSPVGERTSAFALARALAGRVSPPEIRLSTRSLTRAQVESLHASSDCFVSLSRGEGWGLPAFDAAAFGNPVIITGWGGSLEFLPEGYPYCVDYDLVARRFDETDHWRRAQPGELWAKARVTHASMLMREVFEQREEASRWGRMLKATVSSGFAEPVITRRLIEALS
jgi:glycosyltransferase involved in cell wall biosynthesis